MKIICDSVKILSDGDRPCGARTRAGRVHNPVNAGFGPWPCAGTNAGVARKIARATFCE
jgi:hypothetical protein